MNGQQLEPPAAQSTKHTASTSGAGNLHHINSYNLIMIMVMAASLFYTPAASRGGTSSPSRSPSATPPPGELAYLPIYLQL
ncbi:GD15690 [Drosophila simulans]|uniref:GD15690 n=1 Tax=Drosophila simulans TaxID=7240 RepID=B4R6E6_DROSI|nr:GD15690 [Drosophila simulans]